MCIQARAVRLATWFELHPAAVNEPIDDTKPSAKREMPREVQVLHVSLDFEILLRVLPLLPQAFIQLLPTTTSIAEAKALLYFFIAASRWIQFVFFLLTQAIRTELESHVTRHREDFEMNSDGQMQATLGAQG